MSSLTDLTREQIHNFRDQHVHSGTVVRVEPSGIFVDVPGEEPSGPFLYLSGATPPVEDDPCVVLDTAEGDRFVLAPFGA